MAEGEWEEANIGIEAPQQPTLKEPEMSTDDLVFMIGEGAVRERHSNKIIVFLRQQATNLESTAMKEQSIHRSLQQKLEVNQQSANEDIEGLKKVMAGERQDWLLKEENYINQIKSLQERIIQLENQVHQVALERDEVQRSKAVALDVIESLRIEIADIENKPSIKKGAKK